ncbi:hypothetical protein V1515DRAFT_605853, partial [Lipomyces mesembrius]
MSQQSVHLGEYHSIPEDASPGLVFLKNFLPVVDSLDENVSFAPFLSPNARFIMGDTISSVDIFATMTRIRSTKLSFFCHRVKHAWDIAGPSATDDGSGSKRTVLYESVSITKFKDDPQQVAVEVPEFSVIELESTESDPSKFVVVELRSYLDPKPVLLRRQQVQSRSAKD